MHLVVLKFASKTQITTLIIIFTFLSKLYTSWIKTIDEHNCLKIVLFKWHSIDIRSNNALPRITPNIHAISIAFFSLRLLSHTNL